MSVYGKQDILFELQGTLLQARNARKDTRDHAVFRTENDISSPDNGNAAHYRGQTREKTTRKETE